MGARQSQPASLSKGSVVVSLHLYFCWSNVQIVPKGSAIWPPSMIFNSYKPLDQLVVFSVLWLKYPLTKHQPLMADLDRLDGSLFSLSMAIYK